MFTSQYDPDLQLHKRLISFLDKRHYTIKRFALLNQIEYRLLKDWLDGFYCSGGLRGKDLFEGKIRAALDEVESRKHMLTKTTCLLIILTSIVKRGLDCCQYVMENKGMGIFYGESGVGKTITLLQFINQHPESIFIESLPSYSASAVMKKLCVILDLDESRNLTDSFEMAAKALKDSGRLLIVDEGENLSPRSLMILRRLHDIAGVGVLFVGLPALLANVKGANGCYKQLYSRIDIAVKAGNLTEQDAEALVRHWLPEAAAGLWKSIHSVAGDNARRMEKICTMAKRLSLVNNCKIDKEIILKAVDALIS